MTTLRCLDYRDCQKHGRSLFVSCHCIHCKAEGISPPTPPPLDEPIAKWMRKAIELIGTKGDPDRFYAQRKMKQWKRRCSRGRVA